MYCSYIDSDYGTLKLVTNGKSLLSLTLVSQKGVTNSCDFQKKCEIEIQEYLFGRRTTFDLSLEFRGTKFQNQVWEVLRGIPYGETISYSEVAQKIGRPKAVRAVGGAIHRNPILIVVPCHRVIGKNGDLVGFAHGVDMKQSLLAFEKKHM